MPLLQVTGGILLGLLLALWVWGHIRLRSQIVKGADCPECGGHRWQRVHRRAGDRLFGMGFGLRRYRCLDCQWEGLRRRHG